MKMPKIFSGLCLCTAVVFAALTANARDTIDLNSSCADYYNEMQHLLDQHKKAGWDDATFRIADRNPVIELLKPRMQNLDDYSAERILVPLASQVWFNCLNLQESGLSADDTIESSLSLALKFYELDSAQPQWGLIELPEINFDMMVSQEIAEILAAIPHDKAPNPVNDVYRVAFDRYLARFDLSSPESIEKVNRLAVEITFESNAPKHAGKTYSEILDELANDIGLTQR